jgi:hypothetical protein
MVIATEYEESQEGAAEVTALLRPIAVETDDVLIGPLVKWLSDASLDDPGDPAEVFEDGCFRSSGVAQEPVILGGDGIVCLSSATSEDHDSPPEDELNTQ